MSFYFLFCSRITIEVPRILKTNGRATQILEQTVPTSAAGIQNEDSLVSVQDKSDLWARIEYFFWGKVH